jgi:23S rRNA pseudouridine1911/1915/1917 synthase
MPRTRLVEFRIGPDPAPRLDKALGRDVPEEAALSRSRLARLIAEGAVAVNGSVVTDPRATPVEGDAVAITVEEAAEVDTVPEAIPLEILHEDADLVVVNKPAGMVVHPAPGSPTGTLVNALLHHFGGNLSGIGGEKRPGIVHRIDKDTSGLLVVAKSDRAHHGLAAQFADHSIDAGIPGAVPRRPLPPIRACGVCAGSMWAGLAWCASPRSLPATRRIGSGRRCCSRAGATR